MPTKKDIETTDDIKKMVDLFYQKVATDDLLGPFFKRTNWEKHLPVMYNFWNNAIFYTGGYSGNPMISHQKLHEKEPLRKDDFERWTKLFSETVDELFEGEKAKLAKQRGTGIAVIMQTKIL